MAMLSELTRCSFARTRPRQRPKEVTEALRDLAALSRLCRFEQGMVYCANPHSADPAYRYRDEATKIHRVIQEHRQSCLQTALSESSMVMGKGLVWHKNKNYGNDYGDPYDPFVEKYDGVPWYGLLEGGPPDCLLAASLSPVTSLQTIRDLADGLCCAAIPVGAVAKEVLEAGPDKPIREFRRLTLYGLDVYALAPLAYYDMQRHLTAGTQPSLWGPPSLSQAVMALNLSLPMFSLLSGELEKVREDVKAVGEAVRQLQNQMKAMRAQAEAAARELAAERLRRIGLERRLEALMVADPILFAVPRGTPISADHEVLLGPCWGSEIDDDVVRACGFKPNKQLRAKYDKVLPWM